MLRFDKAIYLSFLLKFISSERLSNNLWGSDVLLFLVLINIVFIIVLYLYWIHYIVIYLFQNFFARYKECMIFLISFTKFSNVLLDFTCARTIGDVWSIFLGVHIFNSFPCVSFIEIIPLLKALRVNSRYREDKSTYTIKIIIFFLIFFFLGLFLSWNSTIFSKKLLLCISVSSILILPV